MSGAVFVVLPPQSESVIYGHVCFEESPEIIYFPSAAQPKLIKLKNLEIKGNGESFGIILSKFKDSFGGFSGSNEKNVTIGLLYKQNETGFLGTELLKLALESSQNSEAAIETITKLIEEYEVHNVEGKCIFAFVICDPHSAWILNIVGKLWAAEKINDQYRSIGSGLTIEDKIDKCSENLKDELKSQLLWDGTNDFNLKNIFDANNQLVKIWDGNKPLDENKFTVQAMFDVLRSLNDNEKAKCGHVSVLHPNRSSVNWFTGTSTKESVFKPFIFTPGARISPLTKIKDGDEDTVLNQLHSQRKWEIVGTLLQSLENTCVEEVNSFLSENSGRQFQELDDLMKDCVEAEVKFYR